MSRRERSTVATPERRDFTGEELRLAGQLESMRKDLEGTKKRAETAESDLAKVRADLAAAKNSLMEAETEVRKFKDVSGDAKKFQAEIGELQKENARLRKELEDAVASVAKAADTRPARSAKKALPESMMLLSDERERFTAACGEIVEAAEKAKLIKDIGQKRASALAFIDSIGD